MVPLFREPLRESHASKEPGLTYSGQHHLASRLCRFAGLRAWVEELYVNYIRRKAYYLKNIHIYICVNVYIYIIPLK